jgi:hypothetical protein
VSLERVPAADRVLDGMYSPAAYGALLSLLLKQGYRFASFLEPAPPPGEKVVYLRHDVDFSPGWATDFARLNRQHGVSATFCFLLRSPLYNLAAAETLRDIEAIEACGQHIALHFSFPLVPMQDPRAIAELVLQEYESALRIVPSMKPAFSWHDPSVVPGLIERCLDLQVPGMSNIYGRRFVRNAVYKSDSNYRYSLDEWHAIAEAGHRRLQLLLHPCLWMARARDIRDALAKTLAQVMREHEQEFLKSDAYRELHPSGLPEEAFQAVAAAVFCGVRE